MSNGQDTASGEQSEPRDLPGGDKPVRQKCVSVVIREADNHYIATFDHGSSKRIFHNMQELLMAIEVKVKEIS